MPRKIRCWNILVYCKELLVVTGAFCMLLVAPERTLELLLLSLRASSSVSLLPGDRRSPPRHPTVTMCLLSRASADSWSQLMLEVSSGFTGLLHAWLFLEAVIYHCWKTAATWACDLPPLRLLFSKIILQSSLQLTCPFWGTFASPRQL